MDMTFASTNNKLFLVMRILVYVHLGSGKNSSSRSTSADSSISTWEMEQIVEKLKQGRVRNSTKVLYHKVWKNFNEFFIKLDRKPTSWEDRLVLFVGYLADNKRSSQTIKSYISAIRNVLADDGITLNVNKFLLTSMTRACKLHNDRVRTRLPIQKHVLNILLRYTKAFFEETGQLYLLSLYQALFSTAYYGLLRVGELTASSHTIKARDVHIAQNKQNFCSS